MECLKVHLKEWKIWFVVRKDPINKFPFCVAFQVHIKFILKLKFRHSSIGNASKECRGLRAQWKCAHW